MADTANETHIGNIEPPLYIAKSYMTCCYMVIISDFANHIGCIANDVGATPNVINPLFKNLYQ